MKEGIVTKVILFAARHRLQELDYSLLASAFQSTPGHLGIEIDKWTASEKVCSAGALQSLQLGIHGLVGTTFTPTGISLRRSSILSSANLSLRNASSLGKDSPALDLYSGCRLFDLLNTGTSFAVGWATADLGFAMVGWAQNWYRHDCMREPSIWAVLAHTLSGAIEFFCNLHLLEVEQHGANKAYMCYDEPEVELLQG